MLSQKGSDEGSNRTTVHRRSGLYFGPLLVAHLDAHMAHLTSHLPIMYHAGEMESIERRKVSVGVKERIYNPEVRTRVRPEMRRELETLARENDRSLSAEMQRALRMYLVMMRQKAVQSYRDVEAS